MRSTFCWTLFKRTVHGEELSLCVSCVSRVSDQNGVSLLCIMFEIHHSGWEPSFFIVLNSVRSVLYVKLCVQGQY